MMATYSEIQKWVKQKYGFAVKTCWIAHRKAECGMPVRPAHNRQSLDQRKHPCPSEKAEAIDNAFRHFKML